MTTFRHLILILFFISLAALEVLHGIYRLNTLRRGQRDKLVEGVTREHADLAQRLRSLLAQGREHAVFLARSPLVRALLARPEFKDQANQELSSHLVAYLVSFRGADRVQVVDAAGAERFRCERIGQGVGVLPEEFLEKAPLSDLAAAARQQRDGEVSISTLMVDQHRVEVSETDRQVLHYTAGIRESGKFLGALVLTVYAAPLLNDVRRFAPVAGVSAFLVDGDGSYLASADRIRERGGAAASHLARDHPEAAERILEAANENADVLLPDGSLFLSAPVIESPRWRLVARIPPEAFRAIAQPLSSEYLWVIGSMGAITAVLILAGVFFFRMSVRELRLREQARKKELERQLQISERLGSLGLLTAGVAHEINNPLEGIGNYLALLDRDGLPPEKHKRYLEHIQYGFNRIRDIVRDLLTFARPGGSEGKADLAVVVQRALKMVAYAKEFKEVQVEVRGLENPVLVPGDAGRLEQVFINLLLNAAKAMNGRGLVRIESRPQNGKSAAPAQVEVVVEDSGPGIPEGILGKIFDPFFTTGEGSGLGLSISYGIVRAHGGNLAAENLPEGGARFRVKLPALEKKSF